MNIQNNINFPPQMIPLKQKNKEWKEQTLDSLEYRGMMQYKENLKLLDNYRLINGELRPKDYGDEIVQYAEKLGGDLDEGFFKHYDILSQPVNTAIGEMDAFPDLFTIVGKGEKFTSERMRVKQELLKTYLINKIETEVNNKVKLKMIEQGIEETEENQEQIQQMKDEIKTPVEIEKWINTKYQHVVLIWANIELEDQKERFKMHDLRRECFRDMLISGKWFKHLYLKSNGFGVEVWNPIETFYHKSPNEKFVQNGDYAGRIILKTLSDVINDYGFLMTNEELTQLVELNATTGDKAIVKKHPFDQKPITEKSPYGIPYNTPLPTNSVQLNQMFSNGLLNGVQLSAEQLNAIDGTDNSNLSLENMFQVMEVYWMSQKTLYKIVYIDEETGEVVKKIVDENFVIPSYFKIKKKNLFYFNDDDEINTATPTQQNELWKGIKINNYRHSLLDNPLYLDVRPHEIQFKDNKLPVGGMVLNNKNVVSKAPIFKAKPYQFLYNVCMNQVFKGLQQELAPFLMIDPNMLPADKGWGGKSNLTKWLKSADKNSIAVTDSSAENGNVNRNNTYPKVIDMEMSSRIMNRIELAGAFRQLALQQLGFSDQRLGQVKASETATGVNQATNNSVVQTSYLFNEFFACEADIITMQLSIAQKLQTLNKDITAEYVKSDRSTAMLQFIDDEFELYDLHCYASNRPENIRQLDFARRLGMENNTLLTKMSDRIQMGTSNSIPEILEFLVNSEKEAQAQQQQQQQIQQQQLEQQQQQFEAQQQTQQEQFYANLENELQKELIRVNGYTDNGEGDEINILDQMKFMSDEKHKSNSLNFDKEKENNNKSLKEKELELKDRQINVDLMKQNNERYNQLIGLKRDKIRGDKSK